MSNLTMPSLTIAFQKRASTAVSRSQKGTVAYLIRDAAADEAPNTYTLTSTGQIPAELGTANQAAVRRVFLGGVNAPRKVLLYVMAAADVIAADSAVLTWLACQKFDYLAGPEDLTAAEAAVLKAWVIRQRTDHSAVYKAVLPNTAADSEAVVNVTADGLVVGEETFSAAGYCGRIAGLIAGTPMTQACTYAVLPEVEDLTRLTPTEQDAAVGRGELIAWHDGEKVKLGRGVNSLVTVTAARGDEWKKIKLVEILDMVQQDIRLTIQDTYIGKRNNLYSDKLQVVTAISTYLQVLENDHLLEKGWSVDIDVGAQKEWLDAHGKPTADMTEQEIKEANTGTFVCIALDIRPVDAMEDFAVRIYL